MMFRGKKRRIEIKYSTNVITACIVNHYQTDTMVQTDPECSSRSPQFEFATKGK